jgi:hypothetical protein
MNSNGETIEMRSGFNDTTLGLLKASHMLAQQANKPRKPRYTYEKAGTVLHAKRCLKKDERLRVNELLVQAQSANAAEDAVSMHEILGELNKFPVHFVPFKRAHLIDRSKQY